MRKFGAIALMCTLCCTAACARGDNHGDAASKDADLDARGVAPIEGGTPAHDADAGKATAPLRVLAFSRTTAFRHDAIPAAIDALGREAGPRGWSVTASEDPALFSDAGLAAFDVVVFLLTSGDILDAAQQAALERFIQRGKGWVGIHSASDTEYDWPWYGRLVGAYFMGHPAIQSATLRVERRSHLATAHLTDRWVRTDEWYGFKTNPRSDVQVLISIDEASFDPGTGRMGDHPLAWYHGFEGGRAFHTALGHTIESWSEPGFVAHIAGAIDWAGEREWSQLVVADFEGVGATPPWDPHQLSGGFRYEVSNTALRMFDRGGANQHLVRRGVGVDARRPYAVEGLFTITGPDQTPINSFCWNLNVAGAEGDLSPPSTWATNVDIGLGGSGGVMKYMGFSSGVFQSIGERQVSWAERGREYLLRSEVGVRGDGSRDPSWVTSTVSDRGVVRERYDVDYGAFPYQPDRAEPVRIGANTHGTDWSLRGVRVYYLDAPAAAP